MLVKEGDTEMTVRQLTTVLDCTNRIVIRKSSDIYHPIFKGIAFNLIDDCILSSEICGMWTEYDEDVSYLTIEIAE